MTMYSIGEFSRMNRITPKTLRHYEKIGLLQPAAVDPWTGYRSYRADQLAEMGESMASVGAVCREPAYCFTIYHDGEYRETDIDVEICEAVTEPRQETDRIKFRTVPGVPRAACLIHRGPYSTLGRSYNRLFAWIEDQGMTPSGPPRESYIDGIWNWEDPEEWVTEIQVAL